MDFEELKKEISVKCKEKSACKPEFARLLKTENESELLQVLLDNIDWCVKEKVVDCDVLLKF